MCEQFSPSLVTTSLARDHISQIITRAFAPRVSASKLTPDFDVGVATGDGGAAPLLTLRRELHKALVISRFSYGGGPPLLSLTAAGSV